MERSDKVRMINNREEADGNKKKMVKSTKNAIKHAAEGGCSTLDLATSKKLSKFNFCGDIYAKTSAVETNFVPDETDNYVNNQPINPAEFEDNDYPLLPKCHPLSGSSWPFVSLNARDTALTSYIFMCDDQNQYGDEILVKTKFRTVGERTNLKTLKPPCFIDQEQYALTKPNSHEKVMQFYQKDFMGKVYRTSKIFIPMNDQNLHWYLMIVDMVDHQIYLLDSLPCENRKWSRRRDVLKVAIFLTEMLMHNSFYERVLQLDRSKPMIHNYPIVEPRGLPSQKCGSNDCGVFVATWMQEHGVYDDYTFIKVCPDARIKLALNVVYSSYNELMDEVEEKAHNHWKNMKKIA
ncbi:ubiquitin-specific protease ESD4 [Trifolium repens]|nr:ubiquitin-specific protease ESD4 [Trifolium repens]